MHWTWATHLSYHHSGAWDEKSIGGAGASLAMDGVMVGLCHPVLAQTRLGVALNRCQRAYSASCVAAMTWISAS
jgi:hypothetical protein